MRNKIFNTIRNPYAGMHPMSVVILFAMSALAIAFAVAGAHDLAAGTLIANGVALDDIDKIVRGLEQKVKDIAGSRDELAEMKKEVDGRLGKNETLALSLKEEIDKKLTGLSELQLAVREMEQKWEQHKAGNDDREQIKSFGDQLGDSAEFKSFMERGGRGQFSMDLKVVNSTAAGAGIIRSQRENEIVRLRRERFTIRDLLSVIPIATSSVDYPVQSTRTNNAGTYAEGAARSYSDYAWSQNSVTVKNIGHLAKLTKQALEDAPRLKGEVDSEMRYGLGLVEESQLLFGNNTGANLHGIMPQATAYALPAGVTRPAGATKIDILRLAILQAAVNSPLPADGIVLNLADWALMEMMKDADGNYMFGGPQGTTAARLWGLPVVDTTAMTADNFLVGNFTAGATLYDRMKVEALMSTENTDDFEKRLVTLSVDERIALAVKRPLAFIKGTFAAALA